MDLAHCGFRETRGSLDQAFYLAEICNMLRRYYHTTSTLALIDIKSAYNTVDRHHIWKVLERTEFTALIGPLRNMFDDVQLES